MHSTYNNLYSNKRGAAPPGRARTPQPPKFVTPVSSRDSLFSSSTSSSSSSSSFSSGSNSNNIVKMPPSSSRSAKSRSGGGGGGGGSGSSARNAMRRILKEIESLNASLPSEQGIERLGPLDDEELMIWEAVINGAGVGAGYEEGRWLLNITIPPAYPLAPPQMRFVTPIVHANVNLQTGEICLDLLKDAWSAAYTVLECVKAVRMLLENPGVDSPLNVDVAALLRDGDALGARKLVELWVEEERYEGK